MSVEDETSSPEQVEQLFNNKLSRTDVRQLVRHLLAGSLPYPPSRRHASRTGHRKDDERRYDEAFRRTERQLAEAHERVKRERGLAYVQWTSLQGHPPARQLMMVRNDERLHHWGLYDLLLEKSREAAPSDPAAAVRLAELSLGVSERLDPEVYGAERTADFRTTALAALGDARRRAGDLTGARLAFSQARIHLEMGTGDLLEEANLLGGLVNLLCDLGDYETAGQSLERASSLYRRMGDDRLDGVSLPKGQEDSGAERSRPGKQIG
jgi:hypothetical protein